jgi:hypothetical protein
MADADETGEVLDARDAKRQELLAIFRAELGAGRPDHYWSVVGPGFKGKHWCGGMCLWVLREAGLAPDVEWEFDPERKRYGFLFRLPRVSPNQAKPGDIAYFSKLAHHAMVVRVEPGPDPVLVSLDGNQGAPNRVKEQRRRLSSVAAIHSIEPFLGGEA